MATGLWFVHIRLFRCKLGREKIPSEQTETTTKHANKISRRGKLKKGSMTFIDPFMFEYYLLIREVHS